MRIPIDNESLMFYRLRWSYEPIPERRPRRVQARRLHLPGARSPAPGRPKANVHNDYKIDRVAQKYFSYTGIKTFPLQDIAMMENQWGPIADRTQEHLTSMDYQIIYVRRRLLEGGEGAGGGHRAERAVAPRGLPLPPRAHGRRDGGSRNRGRYREVEGKADRAR